MTIGKTMPETITQGEAAVRAAEPVAAVEEGNYQCASGCATHRDDGTPMLFYGHTPLPRPDGTRPQALVARNC